jgi:sortase (surface protein transpeptidase)
MAPRSPVLRAALLVAGVAAALGTGVGAALASSNGSLTSDDGTLKTGVGTYADCSGRTALQTGEAAIDLCISGRTYFLGHNAGVFTPLMHMHAGDHLTYADGHGDHHRYRIVSTRDWTAANGTAPVTQVDVSAQFQTCIRPDGSLDRIVDVVTE